MRQTALFFLAWTCLALAGAGADGTVSAAIGAMPVQPPEVGKLIDWDQRARAFYHRILPVHGDLSWLDRRGRNGVTKTLGLPSYVGSYQQTPQTDVHEGITTLAAAYGAGLLRLPEAGGVAGAQRAYLTGEGVVLNDPSGHSGGSFWYDLFPAVLLSLLVDQNPQDQALKNAFRSTVERW